MAPDARASSAPSRLWLYVLALLLLPAFVLWRQDNSLFTPSGHIDSWVYLGFFKNLVNFKRTLFPNTYYGSRLSWILPGYILHSLFKPVLATAVLHLTVLATGTLALFSSLRLLVGVRRAFLTSLIFGFNPQVWYSIGTDYIDGAGVAYCLLALACLTFVALRPVKRWLLVVAGVAIAALIYDNLFWISLVPFFGLHYAGLVWFEGRLAPKELAIDALICGVGVLLATLFFCTINYEIDGSFWFYAPSLRAVGGVVQNNRWYRSPWSHNGLDPWLWLTAATTFLALAMVPMRLRKRERSIRIALLISLELLLAVAIFTYIQFAKRVEVLGLPYYSSSLLPFVFLVIGTSFWRTVDKLSGKAWLFLCFFLVLVFGALWGDYAQTFTALGPTSAVLATISGITLLTAALALARMPAGSVLAVGGFACLMIVSRYASQSQVPSGAGSPPPKSSHANRGIFERVMHVRDKIEPVRRGGPIRFWYSGREPAQEDFTALNATYLFEYTRIKSPFPELSCGTELPPNGLIVVESQRDQAAELALRAIESCAVPAGLRASLLSNTLIDSPEGKYSAMIIGVRPDTAKWHIVQAGSDPARKDSLSLSKYSPSGGGLPLERWTVLYPELGTAIHSGTDGLSLRTGAKKHTDAATYGPLAAPASGRYVFVLDVTPGKGKFSFGVTSGEVWLAADVTGHTGSDNQMKCSVALQKGQTIELRISNTNDSDTATSLVIHRLTAFEFDTDAPSQSKGGTRQ